MSPDHETAAPDPEVLAVRHRGATLPVSYLHRPGGRETLLYFHGLGSTKEDFLGAWRVTEWAGYALMAFDAPGCGATRGYWPGAPLRVDDIARTAEALVEHLALSDMTLIGHSMGGLAGLLFTLRNQDRVRRVVSVEGNLGPEDCSIYSRRVLEEPFLGREEEFMNELDRDMRTSGAPGFERAAVVLQDNVQREAFFDYCRSIVDYSDHAPLRDEFVSLAVPKLYVHGSENDHLSHIRYLAHRGVTVASVPESDHFPAWSNPEAYYGILVDFIRETGS